MYVLRLEEWRPAADKPEYEVSNFGRVRSLKLAVPRILVQTINKSRRGYAYVSMSHAGHVSTQSVHTMVAYAFLGPRPEGLEVGHIDGSKTNNRPENLKYCTSRENADDRIRHRLARLANAST